MKLMLEDYVKEEYLDLNNHMNVNAYYKIFNNASSSFLKSIEYNIHDEDQPITLFTMETHLTYLKEITNGETFQVYFRILDYDSKRLHTFQEMRNVNGDVLATCETMLLAVNKQKRKADNWPSNVLSSFREFYEQYKDLPRPDQAGNSIGIRRHSKK